MSIYIHSYINLCHILIMCFVEGQVFVPTFYFGFLFTSVYTGKIQCLIRSVFKTSGQHKLCLLWFGLWIEVFVKAELNLYSWLNMSF